MAIASLGGRLGDEPDRSLSQFRWIPPLAGSAFLCHDSMFLQTMESPPESVRFSCLVIGPIGDELAPVGSPENDSYVRGMEVLGGLIQPACQRFGITPIRADGMRRRGDIPTQVYVAIRDWDLVIADLTGANPNVMYELALRHMAGKCVISIAEWGKLPFDVSHIRTDAYVHTEVGLVAGRTKLQSSIETFLVEGGCDDLPVTLIMRGQVVPAPREPVNTVGGVTIGAELVRPGDVGALPADETEFEASVPEADLGFLDLLVETEEALPLLSVDLQAVSKEVTDVGSIFTEATAEVTAADQSGTSTARERLLIAARVAKRLEPAADRIETLTESYATHMDRVAPGVLYILKRLADDDAERAESQDFIESIRKLRDGARTGMGGTANLATTIRGLAAISKVLRPPVSRIALALDRLRETSSVIEEWGGLVEVMPTNPEATASG